MSKDFKPEFIFRLTADALGQLFMPRAGTFEILQASVLQENFVSDSIVVESNGMRCRLTYSEWEEDQDSDHKVWVSEYAIELKTEDLIAFGTYSASFSPEHRGSAMTLQRLRKDAEKDFILCAKLLGRSVRRDLVVDEDMPLETQPKTNLH